MSRKRILVGIDFSEPSYLALERALDVAAHQSAELVLVHAGVIPEPAIDVSAEALRGAGDWQQFLRDRLEGQRQALADLRERHENRGVLLSHVVVDEMPDAGLVQAADELGADLVVVGSRGNTGLSRVLLGSVAERVVRHCDADVMVARGGPSARGGFQRVLVPTDFSETADVAFERAAELLADGGKIEALHCWQLPPVASGHSIPPLGGDTVDQLRRDIASRVEDAAERALARHRERGLRIEFTDLEGDPARGIVDAASSREVGAIVMGSRGRRGLRRFLLGSVAETTVRYAPVSVYVVHNPTED